jgi:hypothetical protein
MDNGIEISFNFPLTQKEKAKILNTMSRLILDCCISEHNQCCGSKLGGNTKGFYALLQCKNEIDIYKDHIKINDHLIGWDIGFLLNSSLKEIRIAFDQEVANMKYDPSKLSELIEAEEICSNFSCKLDNISDKRQIQELTEDLVDGLDKFPLSIVLYAIRTCIGLDRIIGKDLDEVKSFERLLSNW